jgi:polysaccharide biosynthesis protein PslH
MRILLLCDRLPDAPSDGLLLRVLALAAEIGARHPIDVLCYHDGPQPAAPAPGLRQVMTVPRPQRPPAGRLAFLGGWSSAALYPRSEPLAQALARLRPADYDVVWDAGAVLLAQLPPAWDAVPVVADLVDDMVLTFRRAALREQRWLDRLRLLKYAHVFGRFERGPMRRAAHCVVVGDEDAQSFARVSPRVPVSVVANGVDTVHFAPDGTPEVAGRLVFEGTMSFPPNEQAACHLVQHIMPAVWAHRPDVTLALVGRDPGPRVQALASDRVSVTGSVPDVRRHVLQAEVFVCPLVSGAGIKNKLLQAWAMERAVVATPVSTGGLQAHEGSELLVREDPGQFAAAVLDLLADPARRAALGAAGRAAARERFAWAAMAQRFEALLAAAAGSGRAGGFTR